LPAGITIEQVYADLMKYLMENTQRFFEVTIPNGAETWARVRDTIVIVLATPNGWDIREQAVLRKAAITASLVTEENAAQLLQFVTESEASVHYALAQDPGKWLKKKTVFAVMDCGGSTVDTTVYRCVSTSPVHLVEACPSACVQVFQPLHPPRHPN
jgi:long-subunit acyl-CoA synthetase (AMP-forming)